MPSTLSNPLRLGLRQERVISPQCLVIFGASGDLTHRKLIPALFELYLQRRIPVNLEQLVVLEDLGLIVSLEKR